MKKLIFLIISLFFVGLIYAGDHSKPQEIHCKHFIYGYPLGTDPGNDLIIRDAYAMSSNDETKFADWVAYRLDREVISGPKRKRNWKSDPWLDEDETLEPKDYKSAHAELGTDRGHQAPLASCDGSRDWYEANYLSNITPQKSDLNQGAWKKLEESVRRLLDSNEYIYVMTGPLYEREMPGLPEADEEHKVPSGYWKIVVIPQKKEIETAAFVFDQNTEKAARYQDHSVSIDEVESRSGLDFFWELEDMREKEIESAINTKFVENRFK
jgi:endonuclease G